MPAVYPNEEFFRKYNVRTDLALEAREVIVEHEGPPEIPGVVVKDEETENAFISRMSIETPEGARAMGKAMGNYSTILAGGLRQRDKIVQDEIAELMIKEINHFIDRLGLGPEDPILVVGLGNWNATPDALGPKVVSKLLVTRHLYQMSPPEQRGGLRPVAAIAPGVLGLTGIETSEIIQGIVNKIGPKAVVCIDALASRNTERVCTTIQVADTGIHPGSGIGNKRMGITQETLGIPVIAVGVPTVVHAITIVSDGMDLLATQEGFGLNPAMPMQQTGQAVAFNPAGNGAGNFPPIEPNSINLMATANVQQEVGEVGQWGRGGRGLDPAMKRQLIQKLLTPYMGTMVVTPKEIDVLIDDAADVVAKGLNGAFHPGIDHNEVAFYTR